MYSWEGLVVSVFSVLFEWSAAIAAWCLKLWDLEATEIQSYGCSGSLTSVVGSSPAAHMDRQVGMAMLEHFLSHSAFSFPVPQDLF